MAQSLYRKYRPQRFDDRFVGQDHVRTALRHAVRDDTVGHAYLFSGPRGTGKTTTARLLAKALNCLDLGADGEPCGACENCVAIAEGRFFDLFELDAASNNSVDNVRDLTDSVHLGLGSSARTKVYIIDEVHMLSSAASNALLKTLEEPPPHVVFVLATTNPEKVLPTIRSRTQHFVFTLLDTSELTAHLRDVAEAEGADVSREVLEQVARSGAGSARDALSLLDQVLAIGMGELHAETLAGLLGRTGFDARAAILEAIANEDPATVLVELQTLVAAGQDPRRIAEDVLRAARDAFLLNAGGGRVAIDLPDGEREQLAGLAGLLGNALLVRVIETLGAAIVDMRGSDAADPRLVLEVALVCLARRDAGPPIDALADRVERLERALADGPPRSATPARAPGAKRPKALGALRREREAMPASDPPPATDPVPAADPAAPPDPVPAPSPEVHADPRAQAGGEATTDPLEVDDVILAWADLLPALPPATRSAVQEAQPIRVDGEVVVFAIAPELASAARPRFKKVADQIREGLGERLGRSLRFTLVAEEPLAAPRNPAAAPQLVDEGPDDQVDLTELVDVDGDERTVDSVTRLRDAFGASVVEERPRDT